MKNMFSKNATYPVAYQKLIGLFLLFSCLFYSCKKEIITGDDLKVGATTDSKAKIQSIPYQKFVSSVNAKQLGTLKRLVAPSSFNLNIQVAGGGTLSEVTISTDQVKRLEVSDTVSYVLSMELESSNSPTFRNLTIQQAKGKTTAFISTYTPTKEWILKRRATGHNPKFEGTVTYQMVPLSEQGNQVQAQMTCGYFVKFELVDMPCVGTGAQQHYNPEDCQYGTGEGGPWQDLVATVQWGCEGSGGGGPSGNPGDGGTGTGNTGGGGNTTPNYPDGYDPCASGEIKCNVPGPNQAQQLASLLGISEQSQIDFLDANPTVTAQLQIHLNANGNSLDSKEFALWSILNLTTSGVSAEDVSATYMALAASANNFSTSDATAHFNAISAFLPSGPMPTPQAYAMHLTMQCVLIKAEHPEYSIWRVYWEASKEMIHLMLDGVGLVPGLGEIADVTNGVIYTIEGDGVNASLSYASAIPILGWWSFGAKVAMRTIHITPTSKTVLKWVRKSNNVIDFGDRRQLRRVLNMATGDARQAHHIIPWAKQAHPAIQKAAKANGNTPFHLNDPFNGIPLSNSVHLGSHTHYDNLVQGYLQAIPANATPDQAVAAVNALINKIRTAINNNPGVHLNNLNF